MRSFTPLVVLLALSPVMGACADGVAQPETTQTVAVAAAAPTAPSARRPRSSSRALNASQTNIHPKQLSAKPNVDAPIPFDRPASAVQPVTVSLVAPAGDPGTVVPALPVGSGAQRPASNATVRVTCAPAPALTLACPPDAPTASICTSADNLPAGCHDMRVPGALYPDNAIPACCS